MEKTDVLTGSEKSAIDAADRLREAVDDKAFADTPGVDSAVATFSALLKTVHEYRKHTGTAASGETKLVEPLLGSGDEIVRTVEGTRCPSGWWN